ncbi:MAG: amidohydrolase [Deltaproteobacteria bacterium]|nr:amidohydrolase [Deltaproteobacteria bacterium]
MHARLPLVVATTLAGLVGVTACGVPRSAGPTPLPAPAAAEPDPAARPADVIDARTRPEPHPVLPLGTRLTAYVGPRFVTGEEFVPEARAVVADEYGRVRALLRTLPTPNPYPTVTLPGALAVAGLHDAHVHVEGIGMAKENLDLTGVTRAPELARVVADFVARHPGLTVVRGRGWDQSRFAGGAFPTWRDVEGATSLPVWLTRVDGHAALANRALLQEAGITKATRDPEGGRILRDADGEPTGVLVDNAMELVAPFLPAPTDVDRERWLLAGLKAAADAGLVAVHDMGMSVASAKVAVRLDADKRLPIRLFVYLDGTEDDAYGFLGTRPNTERLSFLGVKLYADGALGSRGAALLDDYADEPGKRGLLVTDPAVLEERIRKVHARGYQAAVHAIGDRANRVVLDLLTKHHVVDIRDRLEHAQVLTLGDIPRLYAPRITASMQPTHATSDMRWAEARLGPERLKGAYAWRRMLDAGNALAFGSDAPVEDVRPAWGIYAALTRQAHDGAPPGGFTPDQRLTQAEALRSFARDAAWAVNLERHAGALTPGMYFDVSLFDIDAAAAADAGDPRAWLRTTPVGVVVGGAVRSSSP